MENEVKKWLLHEGGPHKRGQLHHEPVGGERKDGEEERGGREEEDGEGKKKKGEEGEEKEQEEEGEEGFRWSKECAPSSSHHRVPRKLVYVPCGWRGQKEPLPSMEATDRQWQIHVFGGWVMVWDFILK